MQKDEYILLFVYTYIFFKVHPNNRFYKRYKLYKKINNNNSSMQYASIELFDLNEAVNMLTMVVSVIAVGMYWINVCPKSQRCKNHSTVRVGIILYVFRNGQKRDTIVGVICQRTFRKVLFFRLPNTISGVFSTTLLQLAVDTPRCSGVHVFNSSRTSAIERLLHLKNHAKSKNYIYRILLACVYTAVAV